MRRINYVLVSVFSLAVLTSCGGEKKQEQKETIKLGVQKEEAPKAETTSTSDSNITEIVIVGDDMMRFDLSEIKVKAGQKVKITLRHKGKMDVNVMGHNL